MIRMTVPTGTMIFQIMAIVLPSAMNFTPHRFRAVNRNMASTATTRPLAVSRPWSFTSPCHHLALR